MGLFSDDPRSSGSTMQTWHTFAGVHCIPLSLPKQWIIPKLKWRILVGYDTKCRPESTGPMEAMKTITNVSLKIAKIAVWFAHIPECGNNTNSFELEVKSNGKWDPILLSIVACHVPLSLPSRWHGNEWNYFVD